MDMFKQVQKYLEPKLIEIQQKHLPLKEHQKRYLKDLSILLKSGENIDNFMKNKTIFYIFKFFKDKTESERLNIALADVGRTKEEMKSFESFDAFLDDVLKKNKI